MREYYKCFDCERFKEKRDMDRISFSTGKNGELCMVAICKECVSQSD